jgi:probable phosphomutase (TIGR03848 family)
MTTLFLIRHGLTAQTGTNLYGRTPGIPLDDRGRRQAVHLAERFEPVKLTAIYSSPLERCRQTVEPLARAQRLPIQEREDLLEMDVGAWTGRTLKSVRRNKRWSEVQRSPSTFRFPDGEAFAEALDRIDREVARIARRHPRGRVAVATHGDIVRMLVAHLTGAPLNTFQRTVIDTASVSVVSLHKGAPFVHLVNDTGGLGRFGPAGTPLPWEAVIEANGPPGT